MKIRKSQGFLDNLEVLLGRCFKYFANHRKNQDNWYITISISRKNLLFSTLPLGTTSYDGSLRVSRGEQKNRRSLRSFSWISKICSIIIQLSLTSHYTGCLKDLVAVVVSVVGLAVALALPRRVKL